MKRLQRNSKKEEKDDSDEIDDIFDDYLDNDMDKNRGHIKGKQLSFDNYTDPKVVTKRTGISRKGRLVKNSQTPTSFNDEESSLSDESVTFNFEKRKISQGLIRSPSNGPVTTENKIIKSSPSPSPIKKSSYLSFDSKKVDGRKSSMISSSIQKRVSSDGGIQISEDWTVLSEREKIKGMDTIETQIPNINNNSNDDSDNSNITTITNQSPSKRLIKKSKSPDNNLSDSEMDIFVNWNESKTKEIENEKTNRKMKMVSKAVLAVLSESIRSDSMDDFLLILLNDLRGVSHFIRSPSKSYSISDSMNIQSLFSHLTSIGAHKCAEVLLVISSVVNHIYQRSSLSKLLDLSCELYSKTITFLEDNFLFVDIIKSQNLQENSDEYSTSAFNLLNWRSCSAFVENIINCSMDHDVSDEEANIFLQPFQQRKISIIYLLCDYCPILSFKCLKIPSQDNHNHNQLFGLMESQSELQSTHLVCPLLQRLDQAFHRQIISGINYIIETFKYRLKLSKINSIDTLSSKLIPISSVDIIDLMTSLESESGGTIIHWAAEAGLTDIVLQLLILAPILGKIQDSSGLTLLHSVVMMGYEDLLSQLLAMNNSNLNKYVTDKIGWTPLLYAIYREQVGCVRILLNNESTVGEEALINMRFLANSLPSQKSRNKKFRHMIQLLATIPEFRTLLNNAVRYAEIKGLSEDLSFVKDFPFLLDLDNKLVLAKQLCRISLESMSFGMKMNILLQRSDPWKSIVQFLCGEIDAKGHPIFISSIMSNRSELRGSTYINRFQSSEIQEVESMDDIKSYLTKGIMFIFQGEVGIGVGVEREVLEKVSESLVNGKYRIFKLVDPNRSIVIPIYNRLLSDLWNKNQHKVNRIQSSYGNSKDEFSTRHTSSPPLKKLKKNDATTTLTPTNLNTNFTKRRSHQLYSSKISNLIERFSDNDSELEVNSTSDDDSDKNDDENGDHDHDSVELSKADNIFDDSNQRNDDRDSNFNDISQSSTNFSEYSNIFDLSYVNNLQKYPTTSIYYTFGQLIAHFMLRKFANSISDTCVLSIDIPNSFWDLVLHKKLSIDSIADMDADVHRNLEWLSENSGVEKLYLTFTASIINDSNHDFIQSSRDNQTFIKEKEIIIDLIPNGSEIDVTDDNKEQYTELMIKHYTHGRMGIQAEYVRHGILSILPQHCFDLFTGREISRLISGYTMIDVHDWKMNTIYQNYLDSEEIVDWFWNYVSELSPTHLSLLLQFCTSSTRLPPGGFKSLEPSFTIVRKEYNANSALPTASTCFNMIKLPHYPSEHLLRKHLTIAILCGSQGFTFS